jgi:hypothetical protein
LALEPQLIDIKKRHKITTTLNLRAVTAIFTLLELRDTANNLFASTDTTFGNSPSSGLGKNQLLNQIIDLVSFEKLTIEQREFVDQRCKKKEHPEFFEQIVAAHILFWSESFFKNFSISENQNFPALLYGTRDVTHLPLRITYTNSVSSTYLELLLNRNFSQFIWFGSNSLLERFAQQPQTTLISEEITTLMNLTCPQAKENLLSVINFYNGTAVILSKNFFDIYRNLDLDSFEISEQQILRLVHKHTKVILHDVFFFSHALDFRGRIYPKTWPLNYQQIKLLRFNFEFAITASNYKDLFKQLNARLKTMGLNCEAEQFVKLKYREELRNFVKTRLSRKNYFRSEQSWHAFENLLLYYSNITKKNFQETLRDVEQQLNSKCQKRILKKNLEQASCLKKIRDWIENDKEGIVAIDATASVAQLIAVSSLSTEAKLLQMLKIIPNTEAENAENSHDLYTSLSIFLQNELPEYADELNRSFNKLMTMRGLYGQRKSVCVQNQVAEYLKSFPTRATKLNYSIQAVQKEIAKKKYELIWDQNRRLLEREAPRIVYFLNVTKSFCEKHWKRNVWFTPLNLPIFSFFEKNDNRLNYVMRLKQAISTYRHYASNTETSFTQQRMETELLLINLEKQFERLTTVECEMLIKDIKMYVTSADIDLTNLLRDIKKTLAEKSISISKTSLEQKITKFRDKLKQSEKNSFRIEMTNSRCFSKNKKKWRFRVCSGVPDYRRHKQSMAPNYIHSVDAAILHKIALVAKEFNIPFLGVHDSINCRSRDAKLFAFLYRLMICEHIYFHSFDYPLNHPDFENQEERRKRYNFYCSNLLILIVSSNELIN